MIHGNGTGPIGCEVPGRQAFNPGAEHSPLAPPVPMGVRDSVRRNDNYFFQNDTWKWDMERIGLGISWTSPITRHAMRWYTMRLGTVGPFWWLESFCGFGLDDTWSYLVLPR